jgi:hypothetical protein
MADKAVHLPESPKEKEFEELVAAFFQATGYFVERNVIEREVEEILELDIISTNYDISPPLSMLIEAKSGKWGFSDLFKLYGWMNYLNIGNGILISNETKESLTFMGEKAKAINITLAVVESPEEYEEFLSSLIDISSVQRMDIQTWRFAYWIERNLLKRLKQYKRTMKGKYCFSKLEKYYFQINSGIFFQENIVDRLHAIYSTYKECPHITAKCSNERKGANFIDEYDTIPSDIYRETYWRCEYNEIQISLFVEHRARLAILKSAIDYKLFRDAGESLKTERIINILGHRYDLFDALPVSFRTGLEELSAHEYFYRYPIFWQWFLWAFGGFILLDYEEEEYRALSEKTGIPIEQIPKALDAFQILFPIPGGWFIDLSPVSRIRMLKLAPVPFMGLGSNYRRFLHTESLKYKDLKLTGEHTMTDLQKWVHLTYRVLREEER